MLILTETKQWTTSDYLKGRKSFWWWFGKLSAWTHETVCYLKAVWLFMTLINHRKYLFMQTRPPVAVKWSVAHSDSLRSSCRAAQQISSVPFPICSAASATPTTDGYSAKSSIGWSLSPVAEGSRSTEAGSVVSKDFKLISTQLYICLVPNGNT